MKPRLRAYKVTILASGFKIRVEPRAPSATLQCSSVSLSPPQVNSLSYRLLKIITSWGDITGHLAKIHGCIAGEELRPQYLWLSPKFWPPLASSHTWGMLTSTFYGKHGSQVWGNQSPMYSHIPIPWSSVQAAVNSGQETVSALVFPEAPAKHPNQKAILWGLNSRVLASLE